MLLRSRPLQRAIRRGQPRYIWDWAVANPELAVPLAVGAVAVAARTLQLEFRTRDQAATAEQQSIRAQELQKVKEQMETDLRSTQEREQQLGLQIQAQTTRAEEQAKQESELRTGKTKVEGLLQKAEEAARRLQGAAAERGRHGERLLEQLLEELTSGGYAETFSLQPEIGPGKRPDAVVTLVGGKWMVVDSKAPHPPSLLLETGCEEARREYVTTLKRHISQLGDKHYHAADERALSRTWLLLPGEGYLQAAYAADGSDSSGLHEYAAGRAVTLVGPNGLRSALQHHTLLQLETEALSRLEDEQVQQRLRQLQPVWTEDVLPRARTMGRDLKKMVATFNDLSAVIKTFDVDLRARDVLDLPKARKTSLPDVVADPAEVHVEAHLEANDIVRPSLAARSNDKNSTVELLFQEVDALVQK